MRMRVTATITGVAAAACAIMAPTASAAIDVTRASDGVVWVRGSDADETVTIDRADDGALRVTDAAGAATSSDATCEIDATTGAARCDAGTTFARAVLAGGTDSLDASYADLAALIVNGGDGADTVRPAGAKFARVWDATTTDTVDVSAFDGGARARWHKGQRRIAITCPDCSSPHTVLLSGRPGTVVLTPQDDDVDIRTWRVPGRTTWSLGQGSDRFFGSQRRRSVANGGDGIDRLVSYDAADVLRGESGDDKIADFGGRGDVLLGGPGIDAMSSMDRSRDTLDGGTGKDFCLTPQGGRGTSHCDSGPVRHMETSTYLPLTTQSWVFMVLGI